MQTLGSAAPRAHRELATFIKLSMRGRYFHKLRTTEPTSGDRKCLSQSQPVYLTEGRGLPILLTCPLTSDPSKDGARRQNPERRLVTEECGGVGGYGPDERDRPAAVEAADPLGPE